MPSHHIDKAVLRLYDVIWKMLIPCLRTHHRIAEGFGERDLSRPKLVGADLWIQSASAGEAYLTWEILKTLNPDYPIRTVLTTNTRQGMEIFHRALQDISSSGSRITAKAAYCPFDSPSIVKKAVRSVHPSVMVILETELWPALLYELKQIGCKICLINGRLTSKSFTRYLIWRSFWRRLRPDNVLAVSKQDRDRFAALFGHVGIDVMPNIKFDRVASIDDESPADVPLKSLLPSAAPFIVFGSIRREEEKDVEKIIIDIHKRAPQAVIGLFPRHMHRIKHWQQTLNRIGTSWILRSGVETSIPAGTIILWDVFGELHLAYRMSLVAFVGGSLAKLGGQNFLEPLIYGTTPVIGPYWDNFKWVGSDIMDLGIVKKAASWKEVADFLIVRIMNPHDRIKVKETAMAYIKARQGGAETACRLIRKYLVDGKDDTP